MSRHQWVELKFTPIEVTLESDGSITVEATEAALEIAHDEAKHGCWHCGAPLEVASLDEECPGI